MKLVWKAPATDSGRSRAFGGGSAAKAASAVRVPAATIWPEPLMLAGVSPCASMAASTSAWSPPRTAVMPVGTAAAAAAMPWARTRTRRIAFSGEMVPAIAPAASSPTLCPATTAVSPLSGTWSPVSASAVAMAAATSSGWATEVSRISSASAVVPHRMRSTPARSDQAASRSAKPGSSSHGERNPGVWAPCPGAAITSIGPACTVGVRHIHIAGHEVLRPGDVESLQTTGAFPRVCRTPRLPRVRIRPGPRRAGCR